MLTDCTHIEFIGAGACSIVSKAKRNSVDVIVSIKQIDEKRYNQKEYIIQSQLDHKNIAQVYELKEDEAYYYIIMEYYDGLDLAKYVKHNELTIDKITCILLQIVDALEYCHSRHIYHRDIKLNNILIKNLDSLEIVVIDFGFATQQETILTDYPGSPRYASPELISGIPYRGEKSDVWATGVLLYYLLIGEYPFKGRIRKVLIEQIKYTDPLKDCQLPNKYIDLLSKMLSKKQADRPTMTEIKNYLN